MNALTGLVSHHFQKNTTNRGYILPDAKLQTSSIKNSSILSALIPLSDLALPFWLHFILPVMPQAEGKKHFWIFPLSIMANAGAIFTPFASVSQH